jgi:hypothetical protein
LLIQVRSSICHIKPRIITKSYIYKGSIKREYTLPPGFSSAFDSRPSTKGGGHIKLNDISDTNCKDDSSDFARSKEDILDIIIVLDGRANIG